MGTGRIYIFNVSKWSGLDIRMECLYLLSIKGIIIITIREKLKIFSIRKRIIYLSCLLGTVNELLLQLICFMYNITFQIIVFYSD